MTGSVKLTSKKYLYRNTIRLFSASLLSFILRYGLLCLTGAAVYTVPSLGFYKKMQSRYGDIYIDIAFAVILFIILFFILLFNSCIHLGEKYIYFKRADGEHGSTGLLFCFLKRKKAINTFLFSLKYSVIKFLWLLYFLFPFLFSSSATYYIYVTTDISPQALFCLIAGCTVTLFTGLIYYKKFSFRYAFAPYYFALSGCTNKKAIKKSTVVTDSLLNKRHSLKLSFSGWFLLCILIFPLIYVVPYYKLSKARMLIVTANSPLCPKEKHKPVVIEKLTSLSENYSV